MPPEETPAAPSAAPAATAPPIPAAPGEGQHVRQETLNEDDAIIEQLRAEHAGKIGAKPTAAPKAGRAKDGKFAKTSARTASQPGDTEYGNQSSTTDDGDAASQEPASASAPAFETPEAAVEAITAAIETWDVDALAKATGKPRAFFQLNDAKWAAFRSQQAAIRNEKAAVQRGQAELEANRQTLEATRQEAAKEYGAAIRAAVAYQSGDMESFVTLVETLTGEPYDTAQKNVIQGALAADPATKAMRKKLLQQEKELAELKRESTERKKAAEPAPDDGKKRYAVAIKAIDAELGQHDAKALRGYHDKIIAKVRASWNETDGAYDKSFAEAADELVSEFDAEASARGFVKGNSKPVTAVATRREATLPPRGRSADAHAPSKPRWETEDLDDDAIIQTLEADRKAGRLGK